VIALLAVDRLVRPAGSGDLLTRKLLVEALDLLQAQDVGLHIAQEAEHQPQAQADGIDVPGSDGDGHGGRVLMPARTLTVKAAA
jgi:hypothetical protein